MFGLGQNDEEQRFCNFVTIGAFMTDKELVDSIPFFVVVALISFVGLVAYCLIA